ncbi:hypothetical protein J2X20_002927 [Pelomonas saccharophila]|uniref:PEP-CTERM protein-sorting domain-containing protein n=1 Tax=Roseateles saccharophilus TaxID=304 RepID=A0ABU1YN62_ROSSA|nr:PEP-CTERM sorting domain-containing protein [Roseateles saccharophilus]MDR7270269.1 hypothetical protein [Roseateles saccharophilus]
MKKTSWGIRSQWLLALLLPAGLASAAPLPVYSPSYPSPNSACATFGNFVSCSTKVLDNLASRGFAGFNGPYGFSASQGALIDTIVVTANNGNILNNGDQINPSEDGFSSNNGGNKKYFFTGDGNDPTNNGALAGDTPFSWDTSINALNQKLTFGGAYHQMAIAFDFNNPQNDTSSIPIWALVTIRDTDGNLGNQYFETQALDPNGIFKDPSLHTSTKTFDGNNITTPGAADFALTVGAVCVVDALVSYPSPNGSSCPNGGQLVNTNQASNEVEFINYLPTLDLRSLQAQGYDTMSVQVWMGCFNTGVNGAGPALAGGGSVGPCDTGGFGDIFLIAGAAEPGRVPEPGTLGLTGLTLLGLLRRRGR